MIQIQSEDRLRALEREKERMAGQILQLKEEAK